MRRSLSPKYIVEGLRHANFSITRIIRLLPEPVVPHKYMPLQRSPRVYSVRLSLMVMASIAGSPTTQRAICR